MSRVRRALDNTTALRLVVCGGVCLSELLSQGFLMLLQCCGVLMSGLRSWLTELAHVEARKIRNSLEQT